MKSCCLGLLALISLTLLVDTNALAEPPVHQRIDQLILEAAGDLPVAPRSSDAEFLRRVYLDLAGRIPSRDEAASFLASESNNKRERLIDQLLASDDYPRHMSEQFNILLMERLGDDPAWRTFLLTSFEANMPWDEMARNLLRANRDNENMRGSAYFLTSRLISEGAMAATDVPGLTRDVARLLIGKDLQCAQCHDHLSIDDYLQEDFQGLHTVFLNIKADRSAGFPAVTEGLMTKKQEFMSVFLQEPRETGPRVPGVGEIEIPTFPEGEEYEVMPDRKKKIVGVPKFSPLAELALGLTGKENVVFRRNIANRLWFLMLGRGLVHPLDVHSAGNPASHPALLDLLGEEFAGHDFDIKWLLKQIALSETYQRTSVLSEGQSPPPRDRFVLAHQKRISAEQLARSTLVALGELSDYQADDERMEDYRKDFLKMFTNPPREPEVEFQPSVKGTLFALNSSRAMKLFERREGNLIDRLAELPDDEIADELFLSILSRPAEEVDRDDVEEFLNAASDRETALSQLAWALWASNEFIINH